MTPGGAFRFYKPPCYKENVPEGSQSAQSAPSNTRVRAFRNTTPAELALKFKQPTEIPVPPRPPPPRAIPSTCPQPFKFHPISTPSANAVKLGDCSNASLPQLGPNASSTSANITSSDPIQSSEIPPAKKAVFRHDKVKMTWASMDEAKVWMEVEEQGKGFKFASKGTIPTHGAAVEWTMKFRYVCSRGASGGRKVYEKKKTDRATKKIISQRDTGCKCALRLTLYPDRVEGSYVAAHNHP